MSPSPPRRGDRDSQPTIWPRFRGEGHLSLQPLHAFGIARRIEQVSRDVFKVNPGSLLTALQRLERAGLLDAAWRETANSRRARYYSLTRTGRKRLEVEAADWKRRSGAVHRLLSAES